MIEAYKKFFQNYANFTGRTNKADYWWAFLCNLIVTTVLGWIPIIGWLVSLGLACPGVAISIRRLRDVGEKWSYIFMGLIPFAGPIILIVKFCKPSFDGGEVAAAPVAPVTPEVAPVTPEVAPVAPATETPVAPVNEENPNQNNL